MNEKSDDIVPGKPDEVVNEKSPRSDSNSLTPQTTVETGEAKPRTWWDRIKEPGSVWQILIAALLAIAIGLPISSTVENVPQAATKLVGIPGDLWLRALKATILPMIISAMVLAVIRLRDMAKEGTALAIWTIVYYIVTTFIAVMHSCILVGVGWSKLMVTVSGDALAVAEKDEETIKERESVEIHDTVVEMFRSFVPDNIVDALATDSLLAIITASIVLAFCIRGPNSSLLRAIKEIDGIVTKVVTVLIHLAPYGVFSLILSNIMRLDIREIGLNLGILIAGTLVGMFLHMFIILPAIYILIVRKNPYSMWIKCSPAWITAWGTASSAATLPVTMRCILERGCPVLVAKFTVPLGCMINMDGTAIYFPIVVTFLAATQGITLTPINYVIVALLSTLASIGTTPIPSSSLVLTVMIASSINVPITGMYAVVVAIDWFLDRFRTAVNVSGDLFAATILTKLSGIQDTEDVVYEDEMAADVNRRSTERV